MAIPFQNPRVNGFESNWRRTFLGCLFLAVVTLAVYWPARHYHFVAYDDDDYVYQNPMVQAGLTWQGVQWAFVDRQANNWHPLTWLSHMTDCQIFGLNAGGPHLVNVAIHCANAVLLLLLLQMMTRRVRDASPDPFWRNLFIAALFALHPLRVESVAWISERKDVLSAFFGLLALLFYTNYISCFSGNSKLKTQNSTLVSNSSLVPYHSSLFYWLALFFFTCSLMSKPMLVTLPLIMLLLDYWPLQRLALNVPPVGPRCRAASDAGTESRQDVSNISKFRALLLEKLPFFLLAAVFCGITLLAQNPGLPGQNLGFFPRIETVVVNYLGYLEKLLWPQNLSFLYLRPDNIPLIQFLLALLILLFISALVFAMRRRCPALVTGWLWFLIVLFPVSGVVSLGRLSIADRYTYLPSIGFYWMVAYGLADLAAKLFPARAKKMLLAAGAAMVLAVCAVLSRQQLACWQNTQTLYEHALKVDPNNYVAKQNLHIYLFEKAHPDIRKPPPDY